MIKSKLQSLLLATTALTVLSGTAHAEIKHMIRDVQASKSPYRNAAREMFIQNEFFSMGFNEFGSIGTLSNAGAPDGIEWNLGASNLAWVADLDGFGKGTAGVPGEWVAVAVNMEGFSVSYKAGGVQSDLTQRRLAGWKDIPMISLKDISTNTVGASEWVGLTKDKLQIQQVISLMEGAKFLRVNVTLTNVSDKAMTDLRYLRTLEPDQGYDREILDYNKAMQTIQTILRQGQGEALVKATSLAGKYPSFYYAKDPRAVASFIPVAALLKGGALAYPEYLDKPMAVGATHKGDNTSAIAFKLGDLQPGKQAYLTFYMGITDDLDATLKMIDSGAAPDPKPEPVNTAPVAIDDTLALEFGKAGSVNLMANDRDAEGDKLMIKLIAAPKNAKAVLAADGTVAITPKCWLQRQR